MQRLVEQAAILRAETDWRVARPWAAVQNAMTEMGAGAGKGTGEPSTEKEDEREPVVAFQMRLPWLEVQGAS